MSRMTCGLSGVITIFQSSSSSTLLISIHHHHHRKVVSLFIVLLWMMVGLGGVGVLSYPTGPITTMTTNRSITSGASLVKMDSSGSGCGIELSRFTNLGNGSFIYPIDITIKIWESGIVLESVARSKSEVHSNGIYGVTFDLLKILKGSAPGLLKRKQLRLQFLQESPGLIMSSSLNDSSKNPLTSSSRNSRTTTLQQDTSSSNTNSKKSLSSNQQQQQCLPRVNIKTGRKYYVFINKIGNNHFLPSFTPELINRKTTRGVHSILCDGCGQSPLVEATVKEIRLESDELTQRTARRLRLHCKLRRGNPIPIIRWFKNNHPINPSLISSGRIRLRIKRRQSILIIRNPSEMDVGVYRCSVKNSLGSSSDLIKVISSSSTRRIDTTVSSGRNPSTTASTLWPIQSTTCPYDTYCLNGGTCSYYESISEYVCQCAEGFHGVRCSIKEVTTRTGQPPSVYIPMCLGGTSY